MHQTQKDILGILIFKEKARFAELNISSISNDHFAFHLKRLIEQGLIKKNNQGFYSLSIVGKECANRLDVDSKKIDIERQAKIGVLVVCVNDSKNTKYLIQQRLKHPYYGFYGFISGKIRWGETVCEAAQRELEEETGLKAKVHLVGIEHKIDYSKENKLLEDKYFYIVKATNPMGQLLESFRGGRNTWLTKEDVKKLPDLFDDVLKAIEVVDKGRLTFFEDKYNVSRY